MRTRFCRKAALALSFALASMHGTLAAPVPVCPWLAQGTAEAMLGGPSQLTLDQTSARQGVCIFSRQESSTRRSLRVTVEPTSQGPGGLAAYLAQCASPTTPLRAGNQAFLCAAHSAILAAGRVRDAAFVLSLSVPEGGAADASAREKVARAAEQVAGNLF